MKGKNQDPKSPISNDSPTLSHQDTPLPLNITLLRTHSTATHIVHWTEVKLRKTCKCPKGK